METLTDNERLEQLIDLLIDFMPQLNSVIGNRSTVQHTLDAVNRLRGRCDDDGHLELESE